MTKCEISGVAESHTVGFLQVPHSLNEGRFTYTARVWPVVDATTPIGWAKTGPTTQFRTLDE